MLLLLFAAAGFLIPLWPFAVVPVSGAAPLYEGFHDTVDCNSVAGWVWDKNSPGTRLNVTVYNSVTGVVIATGTANQFRQDLVNAGKGDGFYGFSIATPASVKDGVTRSIAVKVTGTSFNLGNTPKSFNSSSSGCTLAGPVTMTILTRTPESRHANFRVQSTGFSVSYTTNKYHVYGTGGYDGWRWTSDYTGWDSLPGCYYATTGPGYVNDWRIACESDQANGDYTWKSFSPGDQLDFAALRAARVMPTRLGNDSSAPVKQGTIARVFSSSTPGTSYYFGVTSDVSGPLQLWKTSSLSKPFQYESDVVIEDPTFKAGAFGWEMGFTHHADNTPASPRILSSGFDWWMTEDLRAQSPTHASIDGWVVITRHTAKLTGF